MHRIRASQIVADIRSGVSETELLERYDLSPRRFRRLVQMLVNKQVIAHEELYERSATCRRVADRLASRRFQRIYVATPLRVRDGTGPSHGFVRDMSEKGIRTAGINAKVGESKTLTLPLTEIVEAQPLVFDAICRWSKEKGSTRKYMACGFELTGIAEEFRSRFLDLIELFRSYVQDEPWTLENGFTTTDLLQSAQPTRLLENPRVFSGKIHGIDILDFVQFALINGAKTRIHIRSSQGDEGHLYLDGGKVVHAVQGELTGSDAFFSCMTFSGGEFDTKPWSEPSYPTIHEYGDYLLMEAARRRDESDLRSLRHAN